MNTQLWSFRRRLLRGAFFSSLRAFALGTVIALGVLLALDAQLDAWRGEATVRAVADRLPLAVILGQALALVRLCLAFVANPLTFRYVRSHIENAPVFEPGPIPGEPDPVGAILLARGLSPALTVSDDPSAAGTVFDLYQSSEKLVTAAVSRRTGDLTLLTGLSDGRVLQTASLQALPHDDLVVNTVPRADVDALIASHRSLLGVLVMREIRPVVSSPRLWLHAIQCEHESYQQLGPFAGSLCNLAARRALGRLLVRIPGEAVLELAVPRPPIPATPSGITPLAHAFGAA